ncbi:MAG: phosphatase PAP2 family protein [Cyclobacteriaceae bacterium]|nr:phosphatase PAP2 family protein [Cyclobacteriaceae bacterium]
MRSIHFSKIAVLFFAVVLLPISCKDIDNSEHLVAQAPLSIDANAGTWAPVFLNPINQIAVPAPTLVGSAAYLAELATIKDLQSKLTPAQKKSIEYWSVGGILRWNQIFRALVARYNLPPAPNPDGSYPGPDAENPFADPGFPFSNPPYAARAYSYASVAQYDALKAAWYYKYQYNRPAPYNVDPAIQSLMPKTDLPSYPSEDAVMSGAAADILKSLFPAAIEEITLKAGEQRSAALWAGKATPSDITAGLNLGKAVAAVFIARAGGDGMRNAIGSKPLWDGLKANAESRQDVAWLSQDLPPRPPMLPFFGLNGVNGASVKCWSMTTQNIIDVRPVPPPVAGSSEMAKELAEVKFYADNLDRGRLAIVHKWADGVGTYSPPGHWNDIAEEYIRDARFSEVRAARAFALLNMSMHDAVVACWDTKYFYFNARPAQLDPTIKTSTGLPNFPSYVSGHSTFSASAATVLSYLFPAGAKDFNTMSEEAAMSRLYSAIHYRTDCVAGTELGTKVAGFTVAFANGDGAN